MKIQYRKKHLIKKELLKHNISPKEFKISDAALYRIIDCYTKEAGVRGLENRFQIFAEKPQQHLKRAKRYSGLRLKILINI